MTGAPSSGRLVQLPGKQFTRFEEWSEEKKGVTDGAVKPYYCQSMFDAVTWGKNFSNYKQAEISFFYNEKLHKIRSMQ